MRPESLQPAVPAALPAAPPALGVGPGPAAPAWPALCYRPARLPCAGGPGRGRGAREGRGADPAGSPAPSRPRCPGPRGPAEAGSASLLRAAPPPRVPGAAAGSSCGNGGDSGARLSGRGWEPWAAVPGPCRSLRRVARPCPGGVHAPPSDRPIATGEEGTSGGEGIAAGALIWGGGPGRPPAGAGRCGHWVHEARDTGRGPKEAPGGPRRSSASLRPSLRSLGSQAAAYGAAPGQSLQAASTVQAPCRPGPRGPTLPVEAPARHGEAWGLCSRRGPRPCSPGFAFALLWLSGEWDSVSGDAAVVGRAGGRTGFSQTRVRGMEGERNPQVSPGLLVLECSHRDPRHLAFPLYGGATATPFAIFVARPQPPAPRVHTPWGLPCAVDGFLGGCVSESQRACDAHRCFCSRHAAQVSWDETQEDGQAVGPRERPQAQSGSAVTIPPGCAW